MNFPSTPDYWIGRALGDNNRYLLNKFLGGGGMGDVFLAMDTRIGKQVALKILKANLVASKQITRRFEREIEICAALNSEHIVKVTDCGASVEGYPFYVMEYLRGQSLRQLLLRENRLSIERAINIITQICSGLQSAHKGVNLEGIGVSRGGRIQVVHRDLKPDNIFLENTDSGEFVKIVDFGIAKIRNESFEQTNLTSAFLGTFRYASPEQLKVAVDIDGRADIYSLGIIFYEMLSGTDPFDISAKAHSNIQASWVFAHTCETPKPLRSQPGCEHLPPELEVVVMRCLEKEPDKRFASVEEFNWALQSILRFNQSGCVEKIKGPIISPSPSLPVSFPQGCNEETTVGSVNIEIEEKIKNKKTITQTLSKPSHVVINKNILISIIGFIAACIGSYFLISQQPLNKLKEAQNKGDYEKCIDLSDKFNRDSDNPKVKEIVDTCRNNLVMKLAKNKECLKAYEFLKEKVPKDLFEKTRSKIDEDCIEEKNKPQFQF